MGKICSSGGACLKTCLAVLVWVVNSLRFCVILNMEMHDILYKQSIAGVKQSALCMFFIMLATFACDTRIFSCDVDEY